MKKITIILSCIALFSSCKDDDSTVKQQTSEPYDELILGTWTFNDVTKTYYVGSTDKVDYVDTFPTAEEDYLMFSSNQKAIGVLGGTLDTTTYSINNDAKTVDLGGEIYDIVTLNESTLIFEEKERVDTPYTDYTLKFKR